MASDADNLSKAYDHLSKVKGSLVDAVKNLIAAKNT